MDIDYNIRNSLSKQGLACVVMTPLMTYQGHDGLTQAFTINDLTLQVVENVSVNRARIKKLDLSAGTALDVCVRASEVLAGPQGGHYGEFTTKLIDQGEDSGLVVSKAVFETTMYNQVSSIISSDSEGHRVEIPFVTHGEISGLISDVHSLSDLIMGFDTEDIKERLNVVELDTEDLYRKHMELSSVYQPIGQYATIDELTAYAFKSDVPRYTSQLTNDAGFLSSVRWDEVTEKPEIPTMADIPTRTSQLTNDSITIRSIGGVAANNGTARGMLTVGDGEDTIGHIEMIEGDLEDGAILNVKGGVNSGGVINVTGPDASIRINGVPIKTEIDIPTKLSEFENDVGYLTAHQSLEDYATKTWVNDKGYLTEHQSLSGYATEEWINSQGYLTEHQSLDGYATEEWVESKNYLTSHQSLTGYATEEWVNVQGYLTAHQPLTGFMPIEGDSDRRRFTLEYTYMGVLKGVEWDGKAGTFGVYGNGANFWAGPGASFQVDQDWSQIKKILSRGTLSDFTYQTLPEYISSIMPSRTSQLINDSNFISVLPDMTGYYTKTECNDRFQPVGNYLTQHQSLAEYPTFSEARAEFQPKGNYLTEHQSLANYYTKQECDERFGSAGATTKKLYSDNENRYIDGNANVWRKESSGRWTRWEYSDGIDHGEPAIVESNTVWRIVVDTLYQTDEYSTLEMAQAALNGSSLTFNHSTEQITAVRYWISEEEYVYDSTLAKTSDIPTKTSNLINDSGFISSVDWFDIGNKPHIPTTEELTRLSTELEYQIDQKLDVDDYDHTSLVDSTQTRKIDADLNVYQWMSEHYTPWVYSDGVDHGNPVVRQSSLNRWKIFADTILIS